MLDLGAAPRVLQDAPPLWLADGVVLRGAVLADGVLPMPLLAPGNPVVLHARAV
ncbi:hypothetical protein [Microbacterium aurantiacum]|uniref:hypothetical protein n=1 Tax=Microbacterium aurantiacum TaxID=162393 RepID=UPI003D709B34